MCTRRQPRAPLATGGLCPRGAARADSPASSRCSPRQPGSVKTCSCRGRRHGPQQPDERARLQLALLNCLTNSSLGGCPKRKVQLASFGNALAQLSVHASTGCTIVETSGPFGDRSGCLSNPRTTLPLAVQLWNLVDSNFMLLCVGWFTAAPIYAEDDGTTWHAVTRSHPRSTRADVIPAGGGEGGGGRAPFLLQICRRGLTRIGRA
jgi:hypothetical protein